MKTAASMLGKRMRWTAAALLTCAAAVACVSHFAQGMAIGGLVGLPGRDQDIFAMQRSALHALIAFAILQSAAIFLIGSSLTLGGGASVVSRFAARAIVATLIGLAATALVVFTVFTIMTILKHKVV